MDPQTIEIQQTIFDLDSRQDVTVYKTGTFTPAENAKDALERIGGDSKKFLEIINAGLEQYSKDQLRSDATQPWSSLDDEGNPVPFEGTPISEEKSKQLAANVLNMAKMLFKYAKNMASDPEVNRKLKAEAKAKAQEMLLSQPAVIEALKAS
jgi:hypothetical protein